MISIIIPVYNSEKYLNNCIKSIINQTYKDLDIILINDGSKDDSLKICNKYKKLDKRVRVFNKDNSGVSDTRNYGIKEAKGNYIMFIDSDDYIDKDYVKNLIENFEKGLYIRTANLNYSEIKISKNSIYSVDDFIKYALEGKFLFCVWGGLYEKQMIGKFDKNTYYMEDAIFLIEYLQKCDNIKLIVSPSMYHYTNNPNSITNNKNNILDNIEAYFYSLDKINKITNFKYGRLIKNKQIVLLEKECRFINTYEEYKELKKNDSIKFILKNTSSKKKIIFLNYKFFKIYYFLRKIAKKVYHFFK